MGLYKWCIYHKICPLFGENQFVCTHHGGSEQCGKYKNYKLIQELDEEILDLSDQLAKTKDPKQYEIIKKQIGTKNNFKISLQDEESTERDLKRITHLEVS